ncbi:flagellar type III secretion system pore protein FliP [Paracoccus aminophilus]|uniref:Flagellar biosynthetic protein FliP n=1 Tax=Paracoccus aminophilus JCM 7686 TaxID=1367847 RepID=S5Y7X1_PARAH|nr:flagellar type III secretion system pore protein FliP [Paracoccus aminophilus]AGT07443.1 flagellar biosynthesis protein FliP [Paracoccus aminophilus JCM 7686]
MNRLSLGLGFAAALAIGAWPGLATAQDALGPAGAGLEAMTGGVGRNAISMVLLLTALSLAPGIAITVTCFPFIVTVLSILRQSLGLQQSPPNMLIVSLSIFLTWFVMNPVLTEAWQVAGAPLRNGEITLDQAIERGIPPFRGFMEKRTDPETLASFAEIAPGGAADPENLATLIPAFMISEIQRAFEIGFLIALPFLIIDLVVSAVLMSMGMMMVPPAVVALPFKLAFFVTVNGWEMIATALVRSYQ